MRDTLVNQKTRIVVAALLGIGVSHSLAGFAQTQTAAKSETVSGIARDALQRPLDGVKIRLETRDGRVIAHGVTQKDGKFTLPGVAPGVYSLIGEKTGFDDRDRGRDGRDEGRGKRSDARVQRSPRYESYRAATRGSAKRDSSRASAPPPIPSTRQAIQDQPGGSDIPLNQTLLQAPDVSQDSFGQIHLRNDHANIQYRINGVILPEGISFFGQSLTSRFASSIDLITGSLPAQYGLVTTGIVDIQTKSGAFEPGGSVGFYGGSHGWMEPSAGICRVSG